MKRQGIFADDGKAVRSHQIRDTIASDMLVLHCIVIGMGMGIVFTCCARSCELHLHDYPALEATPWQYHMNPYVMMLNFDTLHHPSCIKLCV